MSTCILHVGMPKTGTTSIQRSLFHNLEDPAFRYVSLGHWHSGFLIETLFSERPWEYRIFQARRYSKARLRWMRWFNAGRFQRALELARDCSQTPILSSERCWILPAADLERLRDFLLQRGFQPRVVVYVRPIKSWIESCFQEQAKWHGLSSDSFESVGENGETQFFRCVQRLAEFERIFGRDNLVVGSSTRSMLKQGCVVRDFCDVSGIRLSPDRVISSNESLSMDAVKFLYAFDQFRADKNVPPYFVQGRRLLLQCLEGLGGPPFRFHSEVVDHLKKEIASETRTMKELYGVDIAEDLHAADTAPCVRTREDMFRYSSASLDWLAEVSASGPMVLMEGESAAREVAARMARIHRRPVFRNRFELAKRIAHTFLRRLARGG